MPLYATPGDLTVWMTPTPTPTNATVLLRTASYAVREATQTAYYPADPVTGLPTEPVTLAAFRDATCAQAAAYAAFGIDPLTGGGLLGGVVETGAQIGTARLTYGDATTALQSRIALVNGLCLEAHRILRQAGITLQVPWIVG